MQKHITLTTSDNIQLSAVYEYDVQDKIAVLMHMMPATKESWEALSKVLHEHGYATLAFDERGHGESTMNGTLNYKLFTDAEQQTKRYDVEAALAFAREQGFDEAHTILMGASIGANLTIRALAEHNQIPLGVVLSPGIDYHGVTTDDVVTKLGPTQKLLLVASDDDVGSWKSIHELHRLNPATILIERSGLGHGTNMTDKDLSLVEEITKYL